MSEREKTIVGISIGDVNGIGPEIILKTFSDSRMLDMCAPVIYGSIDVLQEYKKILHLPDLPLYSISSATDLKRNKVNIIDCFEGKVDLEFGQSTAAAGELAFKSLEKLTDDALASKVDVIVTAPINKRNVSEFYSGFTGHTGYISDRCEKEALMILCSEKMKIAMTTGHISLSKVSSTITTELIIRRIEALHKSLMQDFGIDRPKIAVLGLNPHSGEHGLLGSEEEKVILPAISQVKTKRILAFGPYSSDGFFGSGNYTNFDAILAMYHDQALIPFKTLSFEDGVNYSAGLDFIRTSPDHGTAYEIAGQKLASEASFRQAVYKACDIFSQRKSELTESEEVIS
ncbi:MAG TPA: 4-hydroxythreonine-4-phosphate dehydrogenase PdxA [Flavobacteriales bacterium]|nr:4-hydroxythreonine-4-phosphate dehydrogenase PdxA [Flavobacteriales bacterium]